MLKATQDLIAHVIDQGYLSSDYTLLGHRQVRATTCPGEALFNDIKNWPHFQPGKFKKKPKGTRESRVHCQIQDKTLASNSEKKKFFVAFILEYFLMYPDSKY